MYLAIYSLLSLIIILQINKNNIKTINFPSPKNMKKNISLILFSIAGIPPLLGFIPKWIVLNLIRKEINIILLIILITIIASLNFFIYCQIINQRNLNKTTPKKIIIRSTRVNKINILNIIFPIFPIFNQ
jgi:NADH:ubiquinone oxidoreductase subunit 2 (subunit N)